MAYIPYNTGNPVPSADARDRADNSANLDIGMNGRTPAFFDRRGFRRETWFGMERRFNGIIEGLGWSSVGDYAAGIIITSHNQVVEHEGQPYALKSTVPASIETPYVTTGDWATEGVNFKLVGDNSLRQDLLTTGGTMVGVEGGTLDQALAKRPITLDSNAALRAYTGGAASAVLTTRALLGDRAGGLWLRNNADPLPVDNDIVYITDALGRGWVRDEWDGSFVDARWAGAALDKVTDDTPSIQKAVDFCASFDKWPALRISGQARLGSRVYIDRRVDTNSHEFTIFGNGGAASGFYVDSDIVFMFDSRYTETDRPVSEFVTFKDLQFETHSYFNETRILSAKFLRVKNINCFYWLVRYIAATIYAQTHYFAFCNIRNNPAAFFGSAGLYDVLFTGCIIENGSSLVISTAGTSKYGTLGLRIKDSVIEGIQASLVVATGCAGFVYTGNHSESNFSPELNFFGGALQNQDISIHDNYIFNPLGHFAYYGPTERVISYNNSSSGVLHSNAGQIETLTSCDSAPLGAADITLPTQAGGWSTNRPIALGTPNGAVQTGTMYMGEGVPSGATGVNGNFYFRTDTPTVANQRLYVKQTGEWKGIV